MTDIQILTEAQLDQLLQQFLRNGYRVIGPRLEAGAIVMDDIHALSDCPRGVIDEQAPARYSVQETGGREYFQHVVGPQSAKRFLFPPEVRIWKATRNGSWCEIDAYGQPDKIVLFGIRPCDVQAIAIQDRILLEGPHIDPDYAERRKHALIVTVQCTRAGANCFCAAMNAGPKATGGFDIALTELLDEQRHVFLAEAGSDTGREILASLNLEAAAESDVRRADEAIAQARDTAARRFDATGIQELLARHFDHGRWHQVAERCLACANCTMVCPTCFCITAEDSTDVTGRQAERIRRWDSCFTAGHSYLHGGSVRASVKSRYRQWLTHKLSTWHDQFESSGCVGCGRCITWCPAAIDLTEEVNAIRKDEKEIPIQGDSDGRS